MTDPLRIHRLGVLFFHHTTAFGARRVTNTCPSGRWSEASRARPLAVLPGRHSPQCVTLPWQRGTHPAGQSWDPARARGALQSGLVWETVFLRAHTTHPYGLLLGPSATRNPTQDTPANSCAGDQATFGAAVAHFVEHSPHSCHLSP